MKRNRFGFLMIRRCQEVGNSGEPLRERDGEREEGKGGIDMTFTLEHTKSRQWS